jgi:uncharacterized protein
MTNEAFDIWTLDRLRQYHQQILALAEQYGVQNVRVFGSIARGEATPSSDIDILVQFPPDYKLLDQAGFLMALKELLGTDVDVSVEANLRESFRAHILKDAVLL